MQVFSHTWNELVTVNLKAYALYSQQNSVDKFVSCDNEPVSRKNQQPAADGSNSSFDSNIGAGAPRRSSAYKLLLLSCDRLLVAMRGSHAVVCFDLSPLRAFLPSASAGSLSSTGSAVFCPPPPPTRRVSSGSSGNRSRANSFLAAKRPNRKSSTATNAGVPSASASSQSQSQQGQGQSQNAEARAGAGAKDRGRESGAVSAPEVAAALERAPDPSAEVEESSSWGWAGVVLSSGTLALADVLVGGWAARPDDNALSLADQHGLGRKQQPEEEADRENKHRTWRMSNSSIASSDANPNAMPIQRELVYIHDLISNTLSLYEFTV